MTKPSDAIAAPDPTVSAPLKARAEAAWQYGSLDRAIFAPALFLAALIVILAGLASLRVPLHPVLAPVAWLFAVVLAVLIWRLPSRTTKQACLLGVVAAVATWLTFVNFSGRLLPAPGDLLGQHPDTWSYQALSDYLDQYPRGRMNNLPLIDAFGGSLTGTRFATASLLAFLHDLPMLAGVAMTHLAFSSLCLTSASSRCWSGAARSSATRIGGCRCWPRSSPRRPDGCATPSKSATTTT